MKNEPVYLENAELADQQLTRKEILKVYDYIEQQEVTNTLKSLESNPSVTQPGLLQNLYFELSSLTHQVIKFIHTNKGSTALVRQNVDQALKNIQVRLTMNGQTHQYKLPEFMSKTAPLRLEGVENFNIEALMSFESKYQQLLNLISDENEPSLPL